MHPICDEVTMSVKPGDVFTYNELCRDEGTDCLGRMNFQLQSGHSVLLLDGDSESISQPGDDVVFAGHNTPVAEDGAEPRALDQPMLNADGSLSQNGLFFQAAKEAANGLKPSLDVRLYLKMDAEHWVYRGPFKLQDAWTESSTPEGGRRVFRFRLSV